MCVCVCVCVWRGRGCRWWRSKSHVSFCLTLPSVYLQNIRHVTRLFMSCAACGTENDLIKDSVNLRLGRAFTPHTEAIHTTPRRVKKNNYTHHHHSLSLSIYLSLYLSHTHTRRKENILRQIGILSKSEWKVRNQNISQYLHHEVR